MNILISGSSGLIGSALSKSLLSSGHRVFPLVRNSSDEFFSWQPEEGKIYLDPAISLDVVINLSGESSKGRWSEAKKQKILDSRISTTSLLSQTISGLNHKPSLFISASAIGYYGDTGDTLVDESAENGSDFLAGVGAQWEQASLAARDAGIRTVNMRTGVVLGKEGGALKEMLTPFKMGLGGVIGSGQQYWSWVSLDELVNMIEFVINTESLRGPVNLVSKPAVTNKEFTQSLARVLNRPAIFPMPAFMARLLFGEMADAMLLSSVRVYPKKLENAGYRFMHSNVDDALSTLLGLGVDP
jgi:uncharacterized protein (TIGR01777 family)